MEMSESFVAGELVAGIRIGCVRMMLINLLNTFLSTIGAHTLPSISVVPSAPVIG